MEHAAGAVTLNSPLHPLYAKTGSGLYNKKLGMWVFLASEVMFFTGLIGSYVILRFAAPSWPIPGKTLDINLTAFNTFVLICSSVTMVKALDAAFKAEAKKVRNYLVLTLLLGAFFIGVQVYEYWELIHHGFVPAASMFASTFYLMTGFHGFHVFCGVLCIGFQTIRAFQGKFDRGDYSGIEVLGLYWHFVDLVWIILFTIVYLI